MNIEHQADRQCFSVDVDGHRAVLDYRLSGDVMSITHTAVPTEISGRGIAGELMKAALAVADSAGWLVNPICSYAAAYMRRERAAGP